MTNIWTDGGCRHNPGTMAYAYVIVPDDGRSIVHAERLGNGTNNQAELRAIVEALVAVSDKGYGEATLHTDSALAYKLVTGQASAHVPNLQYLTRYVQEVLRWEGLNITFENIPREENERADRLVKEVLYD